MKGAAAVSLVCLTLTTIAKIVYTNPVYKLVWSDEFDDEDVFEQNWSIDTGNGCPRVCFWGNGELQSYTNEKRNVKLTSHGKLKITAEARNTGTMAYASGRIMSKGKFDFTYGRVEASIKLPKGAALWPAFWMLPTNFDGTWASGGEIDIMESHSDMNFAKGTLHYGGAYPDNRMSTNDPNKTWQGFCGKELPEGSTFAGKHHIFAVEWDDDEFRWYVDGDLVCRESNWDSTTESGVGTPFPGKPPFNVPFHLIINLAVGGPNTPFTEGVAVNNSELPAEMLVDWVKVYQTVEEQAYVPPPYSPANPEYDYVRDGVVILAEDFDYALNGNSSESKWTVSEGEPCEFFICTNQVQVFTNDAVSTQGGKLTLTASTNGGGYTSGRVSTRGKFSFTYGRVEVMMRVDQGDGLQAFIKLVPDSFEDAPWPNMGDISLVQITDDMKDPVGINFWSVGATAMNSAMDGHGLCVSDAAGSFSDDFHLFALEWEQDVMRWYVDGYLYCEESGWTADGPGPYNMPFHLAISLGMGGFVSPRALDDSALPAQLQVDYVKVYQKP